MDNKNMRQSTMRVIIITLVMLLEVRHMQDLPLEQNQAKAFTTVSPQVNTFTNFGQRQYKYVDYRKNKKGPVQDLQSRVNKFKNNKLKFEKKVNDLGPQYVPLQDVDRFVNPFTVYKNKTIEPFIFDTQRQSKEIADAIDQTSKTFGKIVQDTIKTVFKQQGIYSPQAKVFGGKISLFEDTCPKFDRLENFNPMAYLGLWYQQYRDKRDPFQTGECGTTVYSPPGPNGKLVVESTEYRLAQKVKLQNLNYDFGTLGDKWKQLTKKVTNFGLVRQVPTANNNALFKVQFNPLQPEANYEVLETDYNSYSIVYSCSMLFGSMFKGEYLYILTRVPYDEDDIRLKVIEERARFIIRDKIPSYDVKNLIKARQGKDCQYERPKTNFMETITQAWSNRVTQPAG